jgi:hypothetical protein
MNQQPPLRVSGGVPYYRMVRNQSDDFFQESTDFAIRSPNFGSQSFDDFAGSSRDDYGDSSVYLSKDVDVIPISPENIPFVSDRYYDSEMRNYCNPKKKEV